MVPLAGLSWPFGLLQGIHSDPGTRTPEREVRPIRIALLVVLPLAAGCALVHPELNVPVAAGPSRASGYVGGLLLKDSAVGFGFVVREERTRREYVLEFKDKSSQEFSLIKLPVGRYCVTSWMTWALTKARLVREDLPASSRLQRAFEVNAGQVTLLGSWSAHHEFIWRGNRFEIERLPPTEAQLVEAFRGAYPRFDVAKVDCPVCPP